MKKIFRFSGKLWDFKEVPTTKAAKALLGGKGAGLVMMAQQGLNVPPGFTITTDVCKAYMACPANQREEFIDELMQEVSGHMTWLEEQFGYMPLVSVRSGAPISMPGMMDTILNVGLTEDNYAAWAKRLGDRAASDSQRRLIQMLGATGYGVPAEVFEFQLAKLKKEVGVKEDTELDANLLNGLIERYLKAFQENKGFAFPRNDAHAQLHTAVHAVFDSWMNPRAIEYRKLNNISEDMGTAVNVQAMVFGNMGDDSGTGVLFTRNPSTGAPGMMGEFLQNAQGEDVVAGIRTPVNVKEMPAVDGDAPFYGDGPWTAIHQELVELCGVLEVAYKDMVDIEFTVQKGTLFVLQSRTGKRSARAAFQIAVDMVEEGVIDRKTALSRLTKEQFKVMRRPSIDPAFKVKPDVVGLPACPGVVTGIPVFSAQDAVNCKEPCILVTHETCPDDIAGMAAAVGVLTQTGGATSHAAVVARAMDKTCIVGCTALDIAGMKKWAGHQTVTIDGSTGAVWLGVDVPVIDASDDPALKTVIDWCYEAQGAQEIAPVDLGMDKPHTVAAAFWWGDEEVLDAVLAGLAELPSREHVVFDARSPVAMMPQSDELLYECFQVKQPDFFVARILNRLSQQGAVLKGLRLVNLPSDSTAKTLAAEGYVVLDEDSAPLAVPADYAAFAALA